MSNDSLRKTTLLKTSASLLLATALTACGGGGGSDRTPDNSAPPSPLSLEYQQPKRFAFSWDPIDEAAGYKLLENEDGQSGFVEISELLTPGMLESDEETGKLKYAVENVFLPGKLDARYMLQVCNEEGACKDTTALSVSGNLADAIDRFKGSIFFPRQQMGTSLAVASNGHTLVTATRSSVTQRADVYALNEAGKWKRQGLPGEYPPNPLVPQNDNGEDFQFGNQVAISGNGNTIAISASGEDSAATGINGDGVHNCTTEPTVNCAENSGAVYVYSRDMDGIWSQQAYIKASNAEAGDYFGRSLSLSRDGNTLAVGAVGEAGSVGEINGDMTDNNLPFAGAVYIFRRSTDNNWYERDYIKPDTPVQGGNFGTGTALNADGSVLAVLNQSSSQDTITVFKLGGARLAPYAATWWQQASFSTENNDRYFSNQLVLSDDGRTLALGIENEHRNASGINGSGEVDHTNFGYSGAAYVFAEEDSGWAQQAYIKSDYPDYADTFGVSVDLSADGNLLAVGAYQEDSDLTGIWKHTGSNNASTSNGAAFLYQRKDNVWHQQAFIKSPGCEGKCGFGRSVAMDGPGELLIVGAPHESEGSDGASGSYFHDTGALYMY